MNTSVEIEAANIRDKLLIALWQLDCYYTEAVDNEVRVYEPECLGVYYTDDHRFIIVAVETDQFPPDRTIEFFNSRKSRAIFKGNLSGSVEAIEHGGVIYFRVPTQQVSEPLGA